MKTPLEVVAHPSPNFGARRGGALPDMIVLHYTAMQSCAAARDRLCAPEFEVSAHYLIGERGEVLRLVAEEQRAWHAGAGCWGAVTDVNSRSIGIELANCGAAPFPEAQMRALEALLADIMTRHRIAPERVIGHSDMAPGRKVDPGARFDWRRLARQGLSVWPQRIGLAQGTAQTADMGEFLTAARRFGMTARVAPDTLLAAFRLRFRPQATGALSPIDLAMARDLAARFPVDRGYGSP